MPSPDTAGAAGGPGWGGGACLALSRVAASCGGRNKGTGHEVAV